MIDRKRAWGRGGMLAVIMLTAVLAAGCKGEQGQTSQTPAQTSASSATSAPAQTPAGTETAGQELVNPMEEVDDVLAFEAIGVHLVLPEGAADTSYFIINQEVADARFTLDGISYTYRASDTAEDFAGIFERFSDDIITQTYDYGDESMEIRIKTTDSGGRLAS